MTTIPNHPDLDRPVITWACCEPSPALCAVCKGDVTRETLEGPMCLECFRGLPRCMGCHEQASTSIGGVSLCRACYDLRSDKPPRQYKTEPWKVTRGKGSPVKDQDEEDEMSWKDFGALLTDKMIENKFLDTFQLRQLRRNRGLDFDA